MIRRDSAQTGRGTPDRGATPHRRWSVTRPPFGDMRRAFNMRGDTRRYPNTQNAISRWDNHSTPTGRGIPDRGATPITNDAKSKRSERTPHRGKHRFIISCPPPVMGKAAASAHACGAGGRRAFAFRRRSGRRGSIGTRRCGIVQGVCQG